MKEEKVSRNNRAYLKKSSGNNPKPFIIKKKRNTLFPLSRGIDPETEKDKEILKFMLEVKN